MKKTIKNVRDFLLTIRIAHFWTPNLVRQFQTDLLSTLFDCNNLEEILNRGYENALLLVTKAIDRIMIGGDDVTKNDLVISKLLGQNIEKYRSLFPHVTAAIQLSGENNHKGDTITYIYTDSQHKNTLCRVVPIWNTVESNTEEAFSYSRMKPIVVRNRNSGYTTLISPLAEDSNYWYVFETKGEDVLDARISFRRWSSVLRYRPSTAKYYISH